MTTRQERIDTIQMHLDQRVNINAMRQTAGWVGTRTLATELHDLIHPRTPRPVQTSLGVVTYHEGKAHPWCLEAGEYFRELTGVRVYDATVNTGQPRRLTDDDIERCITLPKSPWVEDAT